nr:hypothetical protein [Tanacetum cinerariifolium]
MGSKETDKPAKESKDDSAKETPTSQEQSSGTATGAVTPDWTAFQAYSPMPPHGFLASGPQPNPYMWGVQGSYPYSPYPMPSPNGVPEASVNTPGSMEVNGKLPEAKETLPIKR